MSTQAGMLSCPHCGGHASVDAARCPFCAVQLLVEACPRCHARVFHGHKHCPHCGTPTQSGVATGVSGLVCPRCDVTLGVRVIEDVSLHECERCVGVYIDAVAIERMLGDRQQARAETVVGTYKGVARRPEQVKGKLYIKCPTCRTIMNRRQFARGAQIIVDVCRGHGTWFDAGELPAVVEFVMNGGLERAVKAELDDQREAAKRAIADAQAAQMRSAAQSSLIPQSRVESGTALLDLLFNLWR